MGNIPTTYASVFTQCIRKPKPLSERVQRTLSVSEQQLIDINSDYDHDNEEIIYEMTEKRKYHTHP